MYRASCRNDVWVVAALTEHSAPAFLDDAPATTPQRGRAASLCRLRPDRLRLVAVKRLLRDGRQLSVLSRAITGRSQCRRRLTLRHRRGGERRTLSGIPGDGVEQDFRDDAKSPPWQPGEAYGPEVIRLLLRTCPCRSNTLFNSIFRG